MSGALADVSRDVRWGRGWAAEYRNRGRLRRLAEAVESAYRDYHVTPGRVAEPARDWLDVANRDASGAGTVLAAVLTGDDRLGRAEAADFWEAVGGADDGGSTDAVMYGRAGMTDDDGEPPTGGQGYGDGPLVGFVVGAMQVWAERPAAD